MRILVPVDNSSHSRQAIKFLGHRETLLGNNPEIELVNVQYSVPEALIEFFNMDSFKAHCLEEGKKIFDELRSEVNASKLNAHEKVLYGEVGKTIAEEAKAEKCDLIVMGTRGLNPMKSLFLGSVSNAVLAQTNIPMLLLRDQTPPLKDNLRVGIFVDGSEYGDAAANFVLKNLPLFGKNAAFTVVHAEEPMPDPIAPTAINPFTPMASRDKLEKDQKERFEDTIRSVLEPFKAAEVQIEAKLLVGKLDDVLSEYANSHLDFIVMGSHGYGNFTAAVMGSTAMHLAAKSEVPILIVRKQAGTEVRAC